MAMTTHEKEIALLEKIEKARKDLAKLKEKRKIEIGEMAIKSGLGEFDNETIESKFKQIVQEMKNDHTG